MDVQIDSIIFDALKRSGTVYSGCSEETPKEIVLNPEGKFMVSFDPLDGSSIIDSNHAIGTIVGIWRKTEVIGMTPRRDMVGACLSCYGSRTKIILFNDISQSVDEMTLIKEEVGNQDQWYLSNKKIPISPEGWFDSPKNVKTN